MFNFFKEYVLQEVVTQIDSTKRRLYKIVYIYEDVIVTKELKAQLRF